MLLPMVCIMGLWSTMARGQEVVELPNLKASSFHLLAPVFEDVRVVGMGESTHGTHEFFDSRIELFKYLVTSHGFNTFFLEADYANCLPINAYIHGGEGDVNELVGGIDLWPWITAEMATLVEWMRDYNKSNPEKPLDFVGIDVQFHNTTRTALIELLGDQTPAVLLDLDDLEFREFYKAKKSELKKKYEAVRAAIGRLRQSQ